MRKGGREGGKGSKEKIGGREEEKLNMEERRKKLRKLD